LPSGTVSRSAGGRACPGGWRWAVEPSGETRSEDDCDVDDEGGTTFGVPGRRRSVGGRRRSPPGRGGTGRSLGGVTGDRSVLVLVRGGVAGSAGSGGRPLSACGGEDVKVRGMVTTARRGRVGRGLYAERGEGVNSWAGGFATPPVREYRYKP
jgi:hypothetical protein